MVVLTFTGNIGTISATLSAAANAPMLVQVLLTLAFGTAVGLLAYEAGRNRHRDEPETGDTGRRVLHLRIGRSRDDLPE
ncbi:hypothetical protein AB0I53_05030 [Saccharopolyspora sp. NPDC050389]|uniref:hypothetical protein n=1 Tax=Saccharopolyspora sp. NPDC050389 TaxID=3155516 RepID=UPI003405F92C